MAQSLEIEQYRSEHEERVLDLHEGSLVGMGAFRPATGYITEFLDVTADSAEVKRMRVDPDHQREIGRAHV